MKKAFASSANQVYGYTKVGNKIVKVNGEMKGDASSEKRGVNVCAKMMEF